MDNKYLKLARQAREENNSEDAKKFYDMARTEDPENAEAKYFYAYYNLAEAMNKEVPSKFIDYTKVVPTVIKMLKSSTMNDIEKMELLETIVNTHAKEVITIYEYVWGHLDKSRDDYIDTNGFYDMSQVNATRVVTVRSLEEVGNTVANLFGDNPKAMALAATLWKNMFKENSFSQWYYFQSGSNKEDSAKKWHEIIEKIQKVDSSFATPKEPKAVSCGSK